MMRSVGFALVFLLVGCGSDGPTELGSGAGAGGGGSTTSGGPADDLLPCEVAEFFDRRCSNCHGEMPDFGALRSLVTHNDLVGSGDGFDTLAEASLARMELDASDEERMPQEPRPPATSAETDLVRDFINAGFPKREEGMSCP